MPQLKSNCGIGVSGVEQRESMRCAKTSDFWSLPEASDFEIDGRVGANSFPSVFKERWLRCASIKGSVPQRRRRAGSASPRSVPYRYQRSAPYFCWNLQTTPSAPTRNGIFFINGAAPLLENGGEWTRLATNPPRPSCVAACGTVLVGSNSSILNRQFAILIPRGHLELRLSLG